MSFELSKLQRQALDLLGSGLSERETYVRLEITEAQFAALWQSIEEEFETAIAKTSAGYELLVIYDRIQRQRLKAELWASEARLNALMDTSPDAVFLINGRSGRVLKVNNEALMLLGYSPRDLVGKTMEMLVPEEVREKHVGLRNGFLNSIRKREMGYHPAIHALRKDGSMLELDIALTATASTDDVMVVCRVSQPQAHGTESKRSNGHDDGI